jgi:hypothetical protein
MSVKAKFYVRGVTAIAGATPDTGSVELLPVTRGAANAPWSSATPSGQINLTITNPNAWRFYRDNLGKELYVTFDLVPDSALDPTQHAFTPSDQPKGNYGHGMCVECGQEKAAHV